MLLGRQFAALDFSRLLTKVHELVTDIFAENIGGVLGHFFKMCQFLFIFNCQTQCNVSSGINLYKVSFTKIGF